MTRPMTYVLVAVVLYIGAVNGNTNTNTVDCSVFPSNSPLAPACAAAKSLEQMWFDVTSLSGYTDQAGFWNGANALTASVDLCAAANLTSLSSCPVGSVVQALTSSRSALKLEFFSAGSWDDAQWWVIAFLRAFEVFGIEDARDTAATLFDYVYKEALDSHCGGGLWWSSRKKYKNAITNELAIDASTRLHLAYANDTKYLDIAVSISDWFVQSGMVSSANHMVADGLNSDCSSNGDGSYNQWTYNQGVLLLGLARLSALTGNRTYAEVALEVANATVQHRVDGNGVLTEFTLSGRDGQQFKGVFVRYLREFVATLDVDTAAPFLKFLAVNRQYLEAHAKGTDGEGNVVYSALWQGPVNATELCGNSSSVPDPSHCVGPTPQTAALDLLNSAVL